MALGTRKVTRIVRETCDPMECTLGILEISWFAEFQIAPARSQICRPVLTSERAPLRLSASLWRALLEFFVTGFIHAQFFPALHGALSGFRRGARLAQATGRVMGTLKFVWACSGRHTSGLCIEYSMTIRFLVTCRPVGARLARTLLHTHPRALVYGLSTSQFLAAQQHTLCTCPACRLEVKLSR